MKFTISIFEGDEYSASQAYSKDFDAYNLEDLSLLMEKDEKLNEYSKLTELEFSVYHDYDGELYLRAGIFVDPPEEEGVDPSVERLVNGWNTGLTSLKGE